MVTKASETYFERGVLDAAHPPIIDQVTLAVNSKDLKAGTVLKSGTNGYEPAGDSDTPVAVLMEDVAAHASETAYAAILVHGVVVSSRLLDFSGESETSASETLKAKLPTAGIYLTQVVWSESNFN